MKGVKGGDGREKKRGKRREEEGGVSNPLELLVCSLKWRVEKWRSGEWRLEKEGGNEGCSILFTAHSMLGPGHFTPAKPSHHHFPFIFSSFLSFLPFVHEV